MCVCVRKPRELTTAVGGVHGVDLLVAPGNQDLNESMFVCSNALGEKDEEKYVTGTCFAQE